MTKGIGSGGIRLWLLVTSDFSLLNSYLLLKMAFRMKVIQNWCLYICTHFCWHSPPAITSSKFSAPNTRGSGMQIEIVSLFKPDVTPVRYQQNGSSAGLIKMHVFSVTPYSRPRSSAGLGRRVLCGGELGS